MRTPPKIENRLLGGMSATKAFQPKIKRWQQAFIKKLGKIIISKRKYILPILCCFAHITLIMNFN